MLTNGKGLLGNPEATAEEIRQVWEFAALEAMKTHQEAGVPVVTWDWSANQIVFRTAEEILSEAASPVEETSEQSVNP